VIVLVVVLVYSAESTDRSDTIFCNFLKSKKLNNFFKNKFLKKVGPKPTGKVQNLDGWTRHWAGSSTVLLQYWLAGRALVLCATAGNWWKLETQKLESTAK
jgi:hypothetical protein